MKKHLLNFVAGFLSILIFQQGILGIVYLAGFALVKPYNMNPTSPLGVPVVISMAFFGGLWGILIGYLVRNDPPKMFWLKVILLGAIAPTAALYLIEYPIKGIAFNPMMLPLNLILNGIWGIGLGLFIKLYSKIDKKA